MVSSILTRPEPAEAATHVRVPASGRLQHRRSATSLSTKLDTLDAAVPVHFVGGPLDGFVSTIGMVRSRYVNGKVPCLIEASECNFLGTYNVHLPPHWMLHTTEPSVSDGKIHWATYAFDGAYDKRGRMRMVSPTCKPAML